MMPDKITDPSSGTSAILDAAIEYAEMGMSVIPVKPSDKTPLIKWEAYQSRIATQDEIESWWKKWPTANVAIVCGRVSNLFIIDADGDQGIVWMNKNLPPTPVYSKTAKGCHALYRIPKNCLVRNSVRLAPEIDIRGEGGYFVAPPSIHASGHQYHWQFSHTGSGWDDIPEYQPPTATMGGSGGNLNIDLSGVKAAPINQGVAKGQRNATLAQLVGKWITAGLDPSEIEILARAWNQYNSPPIGDRELQKTIQSVHKTHLKNHPPIEIDGLQVDYQAVKGTEFPDHLLHPGGLMQSLMEWIEKSSAVSCPVFSLAAAVATVGTLAGHRFQTESGLKTNFYCIALGYAGAGKDSPQDAIPKIFMRSNAIDCLGPNSLTSDSALLRYVSNQKKARTLIMLDEIGLVLKALKRPNSAAFEVPAILMKLFSSVNRKYVKPYASGDDLVVNWHHVSLYGASTPTHFWQSFTRSEATDGFLARILIFESRHDRQASNKNISPDVPQHLINMFDEFAQFDSVCGGNLERIPVAITIKKTPDAEKIFTEWEASVIRRQNAVQLKDEGIAAIWGRACEHAHKMALAHAISAHGPQELTAVSAASVQWAIDLIEHQTQHVIDQIKDNIAENEWHANQQRILKAIRRTATTERPGASIRDIIKAGVKVPEKVLQDLLTSMKAGGDIIQVDYKSKRGKAAPIYAIAKECAESG